MEKYLEVRIDIAAPGDDLTGMSIFKSGEEIKDYSLLSSKELSLLANACFRWTGMLARLCTEGKEGNQ